MGEIIHVQFREDDGSPKELVLTEKEMAETIGRIHEILETIKKEKISAAKYEYLAKDTETLTLSQVHTVIMSSEEDIKIRWLMQPTYYKVLVDRLRKGLRIDG